MPVKRFIVLAKSAKKGYCIAGKEVFERNGKITYGGWIRPVSKNGSEGSLSQSQCCFKSGAMPSVMDVVDVEVVGAEGYAAQPENWIIDESFYWGKVKLDAPPPFPPTDKPATLWADSTQKNDRVHPDNLACLKSNASLYLIRPQNLRLYVGWDSFQGEAPKHKRRAYFDFNGQAYDLALTDPGIEEKYCTPYPPRTAGMPLVQLDDPTKCVLCISLTRPFSFTGCHHKVVATVIEQ